MTELERAKARIKELEAQLDINRRNLVAETRRADAAERTLDRIRIDVGTRIVELKEGLKDDKANH